VLAPLVLASLVVALSSLPLSISTGSIDVAHPPHEHRRLAAAVGGGVDMSSLSLASPCCSTSTRGSWQQWAVQGWWWFLVIVVLVT
jgi:hypothetical protein